MESNEKHDLEDVQQILALLAKILFRGMDGDLRKSVMRDTLKPDDWGSITNEFKLFQLLLNYYDDRKDLSFAAQITNRIQASQSLFDQNVGPELSQLKYLVEKFNITEDGAKNPYVFALLPFSPEFLVIYEEVLKPTLVSVGCTVEHADEVESVNSIIDIILTRISKADFLIADTTGKNPNVFYEVGYAHALGKSVILLSQNVNELPFDVRHWRHIIYKQDQPHVLAKKIKEAALTLLRK